jgi:beta-phosphoglucomutase
MERAGFIPDLQRLSSACHFDCGFERRSWHLIRRYVVMLVHPVQGGRCCLNQLLRSTIRNLIEIAYGRRRWLLNSQPEEIRVKNLTLTRGVIWDLDGVLVDTGEFHFQAWSETLKNNGIPFSRESFRATFGMNNAGVLKTLLGYAPSVELLAKIEEEKERLFRKSIRGQVQALPGVELWLERFKAAAIAQAIASSAPQANIDAIVDELHFRSYFAAIVSGGAMPGKPDPAVFLAAARLIGIPAENNLVIEDSVAGVEAARRAGMKCVAVTTTNSRELLGRAHIVVDRLDDLSEKQVQKLF